MGNSEIFWAVLILKMKREPRMNADGESRVKGCASRDCFGEG